jgi:DNA-directed RNA polymerase I, II, and III subunit RPABC1
MSGFDDMDVVGAQTLSGVELSSAASRLFRVRKTTLKMLSQRGYNVDEAVMDQTTSAFGEQYGRDPDRKALQMFLEKTDDPTDQVMVFFPDDEKVGVKPIKELADQLNQLGANRALMIVKHDVTPFARNAIAVCQTQQKITLEVWRESDLLVDITEHELVPTHEVLDDSAKRELLSRYRLKPGQLPRIQLKDPVARYYGMSKGQVCKITRDSETAGRYITYRICV